MKKMMLWASLLATLAALFATSSWAGDEAATVKRTSGPIPIEFAGQQLTFISPPQNINNHLMVPISEMGDWLGIHVEGSSNSNQITSDKEDRTLTWTLGKNEAQSSIGKLSLAEAPYTANGKVMVPLRTLSEAFGYFLLWDESRKLLVLQKEESNLPIVGSAVKLSSLLEESRQNGDMQVMYDHSKMKSMSNVKETQPTAASAASASEQKSDSAYSSTNVQVEGVDEADIIKTDGSYIYQVNHQKVIVSQAVPADQMKIVSTIRFSDSDMQPTELYVDDKHLIVIGNTLATYEQPASPVALSEKKMMPIRPYGRQTVKAIIYDLTDRANLKKLREVELEGYYVSSRKIGDSLYLIANKGIDMQILKENSTDDNTLAAPAYRDTAAGDPFTSLSFDQIRYFPSGVGPNYVLVGGLGLSDAEQPMQVASYVGSGNNIYASENNLYVAVTEYKYDPQPLTDSAMPNKKLARPKSYETNTLVYKFVLEKGSVRSVANGQVPGTILNQFSMDEHDGYFRIATTNGEQWGSDEQPSKNNVYILDGAMNRTGQLEDLAPGERIYSIRFINDRAYMVTFKKVDPLFVLDLKDPKTPTILGKLKIPGYSDYLQPYDENHIIGFGKDTVEALNEWNPKGSTTAFYQGMKIALFDVTDVANPVEMFKESIGARGTDSELLHNHKALLFSKEKGLLAFPVTVTENKGSSASTNVTQYGQFSFQGMYVYHLDLDKGFQLQGKITHLSQSDLAKAGDGWYKSDLNIQRGLYIGNVLYSLSPGMIKANDLNSLEEIGQLELAH